jgi:hypothetical protein
MVIDTRVHYCRNAKPMLRFRAADGLAPLSGNNPLRAARQAARLPHEISAPKPDAGAETTLSTLPHRPHTPSRTNP